MVCAVLAAYLLLVIKSSVSRFISTVQTSQPASFSAANLRDPGPIDVLWESTPLERRRGARSGSGPARGRGC